MGKAGERKLDKILSGKKTMVVRGAAGRKISYSSVFEGETLYFMPQGSMLILARATVKPVSNYVKLAKDEINSVFGENAAKLNLTEKQRERRHKKCLCFVEFAGIEAIEPPLAFEKQNNMDDWLIVEKIGIVCSGTSIPYNYENSKF